MFLRHVFIGWWTEYILVQGYVSSLQSTRHNAQSHSLSLILTAALCVFIWTLTFRHVYDLSLCFWGIKNQFEILLTNEQDTPIGLDSLKRFNQKQYKLVLPSDCARSATRPVWREKKCNFATTVKTTNPLLTPVNVIGLCCAVTTETVQEHNEGVGGHLAEKEVWDLWGRGEGME